MGWVDGVVNFNGRLICGVVNGNGWFIGGVVVDDRTLLFSIIDGEGDG